MAEFQNIFVYTSKTVTKAVVDRCGQTSITAYGERSLLAVDVMRRDHPETRDYRVIRLDRP